MTTTSKDVPTLPPRPTRPARTRKPRHAGATYTLPTSPYLRGGLLAERGEPYRQPYRPGPNADDFCHGFLDTMEIIAKRRRKQA